VKLFTAAIAQGVLSSFFRVLILKYLQMTFWTRSLTQRLLLDLDIPWVIMIPASESVQSKSSQLQ